MKKTIIGCLVVLGVGAAIIWLLNQFKSEPAKITPEVPIRVVHSMVVERGHKRIDVETQGTVRPHIEIDLVAQVSGEAIKVSRSLENGGFFAEGEVLVQLDPRDYELEVTRSAAAVAQAKVRVSFEEAESDIARREWEELGKGKATPLTLREPQLLEARAALASAEALLQKAKLALERTTIRAPFAGRVRMKHVDGGQFVTQGSKLARVYAIEYAEVRLPLHDSKIRYLDLPLTFGSGASQSGPDVLLRARFAQKMQEWSAKIVRTEGEIDPRSRMVHAIARIRDPYGRLESSSETTNGTGNGAGGSGRPPLAVGMFVQAVVRGRTFENVSEIPRDALRENDTVLVIDDEMRMHVRKVGVLHRGSMSVIIDHGLTDGERICLSPVAVFVDNMRVELTESETDGSTRK